MSRRRAQSGTPDSLLPDGVPPGSALSRLLADASAPAQPHELDGLAAALTAFSTARPDRRRSPVKSLLATLLAAKALAVTAAAASVGGIALAASTGSLPAPAQNAAHDLVGAPAAAKHVDKVREVKTTDDATPHPNATPSPSLMGLCQAYTSGVADSKGKALDNPAFTVLITAAGNESAVPAYCTALLATKHTGKPSAHPTPGQSHKPATHPTGPPASHPAAPVPHPTGSSGTRP